MQLFQLKMVTTEKNKQFLECLQTISNSSDVVFIIFKLIIEVVSIIFIALIGTIGNRDLFEDQIIGYDAKYFFCDPTHTLPYIKFPNNKVKLNNSDELEPEQSEQNDPGYDNTDSIILVAPVEPEYNYSIPIYLPPCNESFDITNKSTFCIDMYVMFNNHYNDEFSTIFDLKYDTIRKIIIPTYVVLAIYFSLYSILISIQIKEKCKKIDCDLCCNLPEKFFREKCEKYLTKPKWIFFFKLTISLFWIVKSVLYFLLWRYLETSDIEKYENFLECTFVKKNYFDEYFPYSDKLRLYYKILLIVNLITESIDKLETALKTPLEDNNNTTDSSTETNKTETNKTETNIISFNTLSFLFWESIP